MRIWVWSISLPWLLLLNASPQAEVVKPLSSEIKQEQGVVQAVKLWGRLWYSLPQSKGSFAFSKAISLDSPPSSELQQDPASTVQPTFAWHACHFHNLFPGNSRPLLLLKREHLGGEIRAGPFSC